MDSMISASGSMPAISPTAVPARGFSTLTVGSTWIPPMRSMLKSTNEAMKPWCLSYQRWPSVITSRSTSSWSPTIARTPSRYASAKSSSRNACRMSRPLRLCVNQAGRG